MRTRRRTVLTRSDDDMVVVEVGSLRGCCHCCLRVAMAQSVDTWTMRDAFATRATGHEWAEHGREAIWACRVTMWLELDRKRLLGRVYGASDVVTVRQSMAHSCSWRCRSWRSGARVAARPLEWDKPLLSWYLWAIAELISTVNIDNINSVVWIVGYDFDSQLVDYSYSLYTSKQAEPASIASKLHSAFILSCKSAALNHNLW